MQQEMVMAGVESAPTGAPSGEGQSRGQSRGQSSGEGNWVVVDRALRTIARRRAGLDAEEARWLREAVALRIWEFLGMVSALDYVERVLGYAPKTAQERLRVSRALGALPGMTQALASGALGFSAVRELTRVATPGTEGAWIAAAQGKNLREIEELVADHHPGDTPDDPKDPAARTYVVRFELTAETFALLRQARQVLDDEHGTSLSEDELIAQLCAAVLDEAPASECARTSECWECTGEGSGCASEGSGRVDARSGRMSEGSGRVRGRSGRAKFQVAVTVCERCGQGWQHGAGAKIAIGPAAVERALCDAQHLGSIDGEAPERAYQDISPSVARFVWHRDGGRCRVPGCRSARGIEIHHLVHRADGGSHDASNLVLACTACHHSHHAGTLLITGRADRLDVRRPGDARVAATGAHVDAPDPQKRRELVADAKAALMQMGWKSGVAHAAVTAAAAAMADGATLEVLIVEALRQCSRR